MVVAVHPKPSRGRGRCVSEFEDSLPYRVRSRISQDLHTETLNQKNQKKRD